MVSGSTPAGGLAVVRIRLLPTSELSRTATLQANCALGKVPAERSTQGIRLGFEPSGGKFDEEVVDRSMFVLARPAASPASKSPTPQDETNPAPAEVHP
jgi:hypothetical protein